METVVLGPGADQAVDVDAPDQLREKAFAELLAATPGSFVTLALLAVNLSVYVVMLVKGVAPINPGFDALVRWGANYGPLTTHGQWWRLVAATFVHAGAVHLLMNMVVLWSIGRFTERLFGNLGFLILYMLAGLGGSLASVAVHPMVASVGASGAVFGLYGGLLGFVAVRRDVIPSDRRAGLLKNALGFIGINLAYGFAQTGIDLTAHAGGFLSGVLVGAALSVRPSSSLKMSRLWSGAAVAVAGTAVTALAIGVMPVVDDWIAELRRLSDLEKTTVGLYNKALADLGTPLRAQGQFTRALEDHVLPPWEAERARIVTLRLPEPQRTESRKWATYMSLMSEAWRLKARGVDANDVDAFRKASEKEEAALVAIEDASNRKAVENRIAAVLKQRKNVEAMAASQAALEARRAVTGAYVARLQSVNAAEVQSIKAINDAIAKLQSGSIRRDDAADLIEKDVLPRWTRERTALEQTPVPEGSAAAADAMLRFMRLRGDAWSLMARALRLNDPALMKEAQQKQTEAQQAAKAALAAGGNQGH